MTPAEVLERSQSDTFWVPGDATVRSSPDLLVVTCPRPVEYLNAVLWVRGDEPTLARHRATVAALPCGRPIRWMVTDTWDSAPLERGLTADGYAPSSRAEVRTLDVAAWRRTSSVEVRPVTDRTSLLDCVAASSAAFGPPGRVEAPVLPEEVIELDLAACTTGGRVHRFVAYDAGGAPIASGGLTAFPELSFGLLWAGGVVPGARGRGAYTAVLAARVARAKALGLERVGLYALTHSSAPIVARMGFGHHGNITFWEPTGG